MPTCLHPAMSQPGHIFPLKMSSLLDFPGGPVVKTLPCNTGDMGLIPDQGTEIPRAVEQLRPCTTATKPMCSQPKPQLESLGNTTEDAVRILHMPQQRSKVPHAATNIQQS